jgi:hypothetical protein
LDPPAKVHAKQHIAFERTGHVLDQAERRSRPTDLSDVKGDLHPGSKLATLLALLELPEGATLARLVEATGWLPHSTRAALTGLRKRGPSTSTQHVLALVHLATPRGALSRSNPVANVDDDMLDAFVGDPVGRALRAGAARSSRRRAMVIHRGAANRHTDLYLSGKNDFGTVDGAVPNRKGYDYWKNRGGRFCAFIGMHEPRRLRPLPSPRLRR